MFYMKVISTQAGIGVEVLIQYIIDGIPNIGNNKVMLYGAQNIEQLKKTWWGYETNARTSAPNDFHATNLKILQLNVQTKTNHLRELCKR